MATRTLGGRYTVQDKIGTGGMAIVYRGLDEVLGRTVAIKVMLPQYANDQSFAARFKQEAQAAAALQSPYIVNVYDWGKDGDTYYIVMEYLRGTDLKSGIRRHGALDCRKVAQIGSQISQALSVAHHHDIIHRDIKPQNIMVQPDGNIKVMDFGIARAKNSHLTADNSVLGTAHYVSPEQTQGRDLGPTTDIYSLGIVMYEAATGQVPFDGDDAISVALKQVNEPPLPPSQINPRVDPALEGIILKCMQKRPEDRFQTADELYRVLREYLSGQLQAVRDATAVVSTTTTNQIQRPLPSRRGTTGNMQRTAAETTGRYRAKTATEEGQERKHRRNVVIGLVVTLLILGGIALAAILILGRPQTRTVPNLVGLELEDAVEQIETSDYFKQGSVKEEYNTAPEGTIIDQDPDAGKSAEQGTEINLVVSKGEEPAKAVTVPDLTNKSPSEAEKELARIGLIGKAGDSINSDTVEVGKVAKQSPAGGSSAKAGDTVTYQLSLGPESAEVPYVVGWGQADGIATLQNAGFSVITRTEESETYDAGIIISQSLTGTQQKGAEVSITVSSGSSKVDVPNVVGQSKTEATDALTAAGFYVTQQEVSDDNVPEGNVIWQSQDGKATKGTTITLGISTGPAATPEPVTPPTTDPEEPENPDSGSESSDDPTDSGEPSESDDTTALEEEGDGSVTVSV